VAVDATGLASGAASNFFVRRLHHHGQKALPWRHWLNWVGVVETASEQTRTGWVLAGAEFDSERNYNYIRQRLGAQSVIPARRGKKTWRVRGVGAEMLRAFPRRIYRRRALIESVFSSVKRKLSARARSVAADAATPSAAARTEFQPVPLEASLSFPEDVNRFNPVLGYIS